MKSYFIYLFHLLSLLTFMAIGTSCTESTFNKETDNHRQNVAFYSEQVQPIFDQKCIACHSCFNSPCQLNLTSYEGIMRGANQTSIYDFPKFKARNPTRLYIDANNPQQWQKKGFYSVTEREDKLSILETLIHDMPGIESQLQKKYHSENSRVCIGDTSKDSLEAYKVANPAGRMPYGLPKLSQDEKKVISKWIDLGTPGPETLSLEENLIKKSGVADKIKVWEEFFNRGDMKARLSARYIYEHLFLASLYFPESPQYFFRLTRSKTKEGPFEEVSTTFPFGEPNGSFTYRFRPITNTHMHKHHIPFPLTQEKRETWQKNFIDSKWRFIPKEMPPYGRAGANPYKTFAAIPAKARYKFMLEEAGYHVMTFIKGPVCRGQTALNVINDHFWVLFTDPEEDVISNHNPTYDYVAESTFLPAQAEDTLEPFIDFRKKYWNSVEKKFSYMKKKKLSENFFWKGLEGDKPNTNATLTVYRHFNSAKVLRGLQGRTPKTIWVLDYHIFESIYYNLTASYNVFGPLLHQLHSRLYMEISRIASEDLFISFLPQEERLKIRKKWNEQVPKDKQSIYKKIFDFVTKETEEKMQFDYAYMGQDVSSTLKLDREAPKEDFIKRIVSTLYTQEQISPRGYKPIPPELHVIKNFNAKKLSLFPDSMLLKVERKNGEHEVYTLIRNKDHYNVSMLFFEQDRRRISGDTIDIIAGTATSYPNLYLVIPEAKLKEFSHMLGQTQSAKKTFSILKQFSITRSHIDFWKHHFWFSNHTHNELTNEIGMLDLNRYMGLY